MVKKIPYFSADTLYTCGAAACKMALSYFGFDKSEGELVEELGTTLEYGTGPKRIKELFEKYGIKTHFHSSGETPERTFELIQKFLVDGCIVICLVNRLIYDKKTPLVEAKTKWEDKQNSSQYIVVYDIKDGSVFFNDPHVLVGKNHLGFDTFKNSLLNIFIASKK